MSKKFAVIGLGNFGTYLTNILINRGAEVLAIDSDIEKLEEVKDVVTYAVRLDSTEEKALRNQNLHEYDAVVVAMGDDFEASILTVAALQQIGVKRIIVRATAEINKKILSTLGVKEIILPAEEAAERLANNLLMEKIIDSFLLESDYSIVEIRAPEKFLGKNLQELDLINNYGITVVTIKRKMVSEGLLGIGKKEEEGIIGIPRGSTVIQKDDVMVIFGTETNIRKLVRE